MASELRIYDQTYADGGYVIFDYGTYATAYEYTPSIDVFDRIGDGEDDARYNEDLVIRRELLLERGYLLSRVRRTREPYGYPKGRGWTIQALLAYGYGDSDPWQRWEHGIMSPYTPNRLLDACEREGVPYPDDLEASEND